MVTQDGDLVGIWPYSNAASLICWGNHSLCQISHRKSNHPLAGCDIQENKREIMVKRSQAFQGTERKHFLQSSLYSCCLSEARVH